MDGAKKVKNFFRGGGVAADSVMLLSVKVLTAVSRIAQTMILSRVLAKDVYGTYSEALLLITLFAPFFSLGLDSAVNYFFNTAKDDDERSSYVDTILGIAWAAGILGAVLLTMFRGGAASYYHNEAIAPLMVYIAMRPCLQDIIADYQNLYISSGMAKAIAIRNGIVSVAQVVIVIAVVVVTNDLVLLFILLLLLDVAQVFVFARYFSSKRFPIRPWRMDASKLYPILGYAVPMLLASSVGTISGNLDRLLVSNLMPVEDFALFSNMAQELPFSFAVSSFTAVVTPAAVMLLASRRMDEFRRLWGDYLELGYTLTWPLCIAAFVCAPELIELLYSDAYLSVEGLAVFRVYLIVAMFRFTYFGLVPTALGKSRVVLLYSTVALLVGLPSTVLLYEAMGMVGASLASIVSMLLSAVLYFRQSVLLTRTEVIGVLRPKQIAILLCVMLSLSIFACLILNLLKMPSIVACIIVFGVVGCGTLLLRLRRLMMLVSSMNSVKQKM